MRKTILSLCAVVSSLCLCSLRAEADHPGDTDVLTIKVSPGGLSIEDAFKAAATHRNVPVEIIVDPGTYRVGRTITLGSGDSRAEGAGLTVKGAGMGNSVLSGCLALPPFKDSGDGVWTADLSEILPLGGEISQLWVGGRRASVASAPNGLGLFKTLDVLEVFIDSLRNPGNGVKLSAGHMIKAPEEAAQVLKGVGTYPKKLKAEVYHKWDVTRWPVNHVDVQRNSFTVLGKALPNWNNLGPVESHFKLIDDISLLDAPGEYWFDDGSMTLYYIPRPGENIATTVATVPSVRQILSIDGASGIRFEGISFSGTMHKSGWRGDDPEQAGASTDAAITLDNCKDIGFYDCEIARTGNCGIWFRHSSVGCTLERCYIHDIGISGVKIGSPRLYGDEDTAVTAGITVDNCIIREGSRNLATGVGVHILHAKDCKVTHNEIADFYYSGVSVGWIWGYSHSYATGNKVNFNHIHHLGWGLLSDMGGIYTLGPGEGEEACGNVIHHIWSYGYGGWGLYTDEGSSGVLMENNLVYDLKSAAFHQHYGKENVIRNNVFVNQHEDQIAATRVEDHVSLFFTNNVVCYTEGDLYRLNWPEVRITAEKNIYWRYGGDVDFGGRDLNQWQQATGKDAGSIVGDPQIGSDMMPHNKKILKKIGFKAFDPSRAGVYGSAEWKALATFDPDRAAEYDKLVSKLR